MKSAINYKLINIALFLIIIFFLYQTRSFFGNVIKVFMNIIRPFVIALIISYILYPMISFIKKKLKINNTLATIIILTLVVIFVIVIIIITAPLLVKELVILGKEITFLLTKLDVEYNIVEIIPIKNIINNNINDIILGISKYLTKGITYLVGTSVRLVTEIISIIILTIYFLFNYENVRKKIKNYLSKKNEKLYMCLKNIDNDLSLYLNGIGIIMLIEIFEYTIIYYLIGHPNFLLIAIVASITTIVPFFGSLLTNIIALITASVISKKLFILTALVIIFAPILDCYIIQPKIYKKTNKISPFNTIIMIIIFGGLFKFFGVIIAIPIYIIIGDILKYYQIKI